jgi:hypothetical protein
LQPVAVPGFDHARRASRDVALAESVRVIRSAVDFSQPAPLIEVGGEFADLG